VTLQVVKVPDIGEGITQVELVAWHVKPGDKVAEDQALADVMTDKATVEIPSPVAGQVVQLGGEVGQVLPVGSELIRIERDGLPSEAPGAQAPGAKAGAALAPGSPPVAGTANAGPSPASGRGEELPSREKVPSTPPAREASVAGSAPTPLSRSAEEGPSFAIRATQGEPGVRAGVARGSSPALPPSALRASADRPIASPAVRARSWELGVDLRQVPPTGPGGRITREDLEAYAARGARVAEPAPAAARPAERPVPRPATSNSGTRDVKIIGLRRMIAQKMQESKRRIPHYTYVEEVDVTELEALRSQLNHKWAAVRGHLTMLPFLVRAIVQALREYPQINGRFDDQAGVLTEYDAVHVGIATQTDSGLMVPVLRDAQARDLWSCAAEVARLASVSRGGTAVRDELTGSTITITSLGRLGGIVSTPVINHPEVAIVGVNRIVTRPVIHGGAIAVRQLMNLSSSFDHRVIDGAQGAGFVQAVRSLLERPATMFID
jgi:2-oxoisovalerate dehydrogenase E2 component (dihydrolipoyl transacylase)